MTAPAAQLELAPPWRPYLTTREAGRRFGYLRALRSVAVSPACHAIRGAAG